MVAVEIRVPSRGMRQTFVIMGSGTMSRYIDADEFLENNKEFADREIEHPRYQETVRELINEAPSIDIVRCKECKWSKANGTYQWCGRLDSTARITADDFCSYGERKSDEQ